MTVSGLSDAAVGADELPDEVWRHVFSFLDCPSDTITLVAIGETCTKLNQLVKHESCLWPQVLSSLVYDGRVCRKPGGAPCLQFPSVVRDCETDVVEPHVVVLGSRESYESVRHVREVIPSLCFKEAVQRNLNISKHRKEPVPDKNSTSFFRLCSDYDTSLCHKQGMLSIADDFVDSVFGLSDSDISSIQAICWVNTPHALPVNYVISTALGNLSTKPLLDPVSNFRMLEFILTSRSAFLRRRIDEFRRAAKARNLLLPRGRRHVSERLFSGRKWKLQYALEFLKNSQTGILEETRELDLQAALLAHTNLSLSAYSCLSAAYITGTLPEVLQDGTGVLQHVVAGLEELDFAFRYTCYRTLKRSVLRTINSRRACSANVIAEFVHEHALDLLDIAMSKFRHDPQELTGRFVSSEGSGDFEIKDDDYYLYDAGVDTDTEEEAHSPDSDQASWYVLEMANDGRGNRICVFNLDELWDFSRPAQHMRKWSYWLYACCVFAQSPGNHQGIAIPDPEHLPRNIQPVIKGMVEEIYTWRTVFGTDEHWCSLDNENFIRAVISNQEFAYAVKNSSRGLTGTDFWSLSQQTISGSSHQNFKQVNSNPTYEAKPHHLPHARRLRPSLKRSLSDFLCEKVFDNAT